MAAKRFAAIVTDRLACELVERRCGSSKRPLGVIVDPDERTRRDDGDAVLDAVDERAWSCGARPGQTAAEAAAYVSHLAIVHLPRRDVVSALATIAEIGLGFAPTAALELDRPQPDPFLRYPSGAAAGPLDTVWLDVTGCARMLGGEDVWCAELRERLAGIGHRARVAVADGPRLAQALARWGAVESVTPPGASAQAIGELPVACLPLEVDVVAWLGEVGIWTVRDLSRIERRRMAHRLGPRAQDVLELVAGRDDVPLRSYQPERRIVELCSFEESLSTTEPLLFVLRGMVSRAASRLAARGEACSRARIELVADRAAVALALREGRSIEPLQTLELVLPIPIGREDDLSRTVRTRVERLDVAAPVGSVTLILEDLTRRSEGQLDLSSPSSTHPDAFSMLMAELVASVGPTRVGVLRIVDRHRPEARSACVPVKHETDVPCSPLSQEGLEDRASTTSVPSCLVLPREPTRVLSHPIAIDSLEPGAFVVADQSAFLLEHARWHARLENVEWWSANPVSRDYARVRLRTSGDSGGTDHAEAWVYVDRKTGRAFIHGWFE